MSDYKPILLIDFDGTIHKYETPWTDATTISDDVVPGFFEWADKARHQFRLAIYSARSKEPGGIEAMKAWLVEQYKSHTGETSEFLIDWMLSNFEFPTKKPGAFLTIDDRAVTFNGDWSSPDYDPATLREFKPWNKR